MNDELCKVTVAKDLEDLIPVFMKNRKKEVKALQAALAAAEFEKVLQEAHRMKGVGNSYGFQHVSTLGELIETAACKADRDATEALISEYAEYLSRVQITFK